MRILIEVTEQDLLNLHLSLRIAADDYEILTNSINAQGKDYDYARRILRVRKILQMPNDKTAVAT